jgi:hypothetical protein
MSLKIFHIFFITVSALLCGWVAWWCSQNEMSKTYMYLFGGAAAILPIYGAWFWRKASKLIL